MKTILVLSVFLLFNIISNAQHAPGISGIWKGTSICQIKNSPCHDEIVVCHIPKPTGLNVFKIALNKIVNNKEEEMGVLSFVYDAQHQTLTSIDSVRNARWIFKIKDQKMDGTLEYKSNLYRIIQLKKEN